MVDTASALRQARQRLGLSQDEFAQALRLHGVPSASKRHVQRMEAGTVKPGRLYRQALMAVTGMNADQLGLPFVRDEDGATHVRLGLEFEETPQGEMGPGGGSLPGLWLSRYQYYSTGRAGLFVSQYHVIVAQEGKRLTALSLPFDHVPSITLDMQLNGHIATGTWSEHCSPTGHYLGDHRFGALQLLIDPSRRVMNGKWVGFGSRCQINSGPWQLRWITDRTDVESIAAYNHELPDESVSTD